MLIKRDYLATLLSYGSKLGTETLCFDKNDVILFSNDSAAVSGKLKIESDFQFAISLSQFGKIVSSIKDEMIDIQVTEKTINLKTKKMKCSIQKLNVTYTLPEIKEEFGDISGLVSMLKLSSQFCSGNSSNDILSGIFVSGKNVFSSDKARIFWGQIKEIKKNFNIIIPSKFVKVLDSSFSRAATNNNRSIITFKKDDDDITVSFPLLSGTYPDCISIYKKTLTNKKLQFTDMTIDSIDTVERAKNFAIKMCIKDNQLIAKSQAGEYAETIIDGHFDNHPLKWIDGNLLSDCVRLTTKICLLDNPLEPILFKGPDYRILLGVIAEQGM